MNVQSHLKPFGSTRFTIESWTKQADCCWSPTSSTEAMQAMPSLGVEVGLSESSRQLALSARHWLEASSSVGIVVIIDINRKRPKIILHKWELGPRSYGILTRASRPSACQTAFIIGRTMRLLLLAILVWMPRFCYLLFSLVTK